MIIENGTAVATQLLSRLQEVMRYYNLVVSNEHFDGDGWLGYFLFSTEDFRFFAIQYVQLWNDLGFDVEVEYGSGLFRIILPPGSVPKGRFNRFEIEAMSSNANAITPMESGLYSLTDEYCLGSTNYMQASNTRLFDANGRGVYYSECSVEDIAMLVRDLLRSVGYMLFYLRGYTR